ncbi:MAG: FHA domain-containing protein [Planctomycetota bacterium]
MAEFIIDDDGVLGRRTLTQDRILIGRDDDCDLQFDHSSVSRRHAELIRAEGGSWVIKDLGSGNGTLLNGERVRQGRLTRGAEVAIGNITLTFLGDAKGGEPEGVAADVSGDEENGADAAPDCPELEGYEGAEFLGQNAWAYLFSYRREDGPRRAGHVIKSCWRSNPKYMDWLRKAVADWRRLEETGVGTIELVETPQGECVLLEQWGRSGTLAQKIRDEKRLAQGTAVELALAILDQVEEIHDAGQRVWSLRASRILLDEKGRPHLGFSSMPAQLLAEIEDGFADDLSSVAPETLVPKGVTCQRSDFYSFGAVLFQMLIGSVVAEGKSYQAVAKNVEHGLYQDPKDRRRDLVEGLNDLLLNLLQQDPKDRPMRVAAIRAALEKALESSRSRPSAPGRAGARAAQDLKSRARPTREGIADGEGGSEEEPRGAGPKSPRARWISMAITIGIMVLLNGGLYLLFKGVLGTVPDDAEAGYSQGFPEDDSDQTLNEQLESYLAQDEFDDARRRLARAVGRDEVEGAEAVRLRKAIDERSVGRKLNLVEEIEAAVERGDARAAKRPLYLLRNIFGDFDAEYRRLAAAVEAL